MTHARIREIVTLPRRCVAAGDRSETADRPENGTACSWIRTSTPVAVAPGKVPLRTRNGTPANSMLSKPRSADLLNRYPNITAQGVCEELKRSGYTGGYSLLSQRIRELRPRPEEESRQWMLRVLQCKKRSEILRPLVKSDEDLCIFEGILRNGKPKVKNRVLAVLAVSRGISRRSVSHILHISRRIVSSYCRFYNIYGRARLFKGFRDRLRKSDDELLQNTLFSVLHTPPTAYDINRTTCACLI